MSSNTVGYLCDMTRYQKSSINYTFVTNDKHRLYLFFETH